MCARHMAVTRRAGSSQLTLTHRLGTQQLVRCCLWWPEPLHRAPWLPALPGSFHRRGDPGSQPAPGSTDSAGDSSSPRAAAPAQHPRGPDAGQGLAALPTLLRVPPSHGSQLPIPRGTPAHCQPCSPCRWDREWGAMLWPGQRRQPSWGPITCPPLHDGVGAAGDTQGAAPMARQGEGT